MEGIEALARDFVLKTFLPKLPRLIELQTKNLELQNEKLEFEIKILKSENAKIVNGNS